MSDDSTAIFFLTHPLHRERQRDTVERLPTGFRAVTVPRPTEAAVPDHAVNRLRVASFRGRLARLARRVALNVSFTSTRQARTCAIRYTWGKLPLWPRRPPFVVELDNPYVLALYGKIGPVRRTVLRRILLRDRCAGLVCISQACRASTAAVLGTDIAERARVVYPYVGRRSQASPGDGEIVEAIFVGSQFWLKGGFELCCAFASVASELPGARLTVISDVQATVRERFASVPIEFLPARLERPDVADRLAKADLFVMPTLVESFGMAALEALAHGLPLLTTAVYALPEIVHDGVNGVILPDCFGYWRDFESNRTIWRHHDLEAYVRGRRFPALEAHLGESLLTLLSDREGLRSMGDASRALFEARFSPEVRAASFAGAMNAFLAGEIGR